MQNRADQFEAYLSALPDSRSEPFRQLLSVIREHIDPGFVEVFDYGMPGWAVPFTRHPAGYHCDSTIPVPFLSIANQKQHIAVYHMGLTLDPEQHDWFVQTYAKTGMKLNMGKSCIRFTRMDSIPYGIIGELAGRITLEAYLERYLGSLR